MKIGLGINTFPTNLNRFKLANASYERLKEHNVVVCDIQKPGVQGIFNTIDTLKRTTQDVVPNSNKQLPFVNDLFGIMAEQDFDYFIVTNADVMISPRLIKHIQDNDITAMPCSRLDVEPVKSINDPMKAVRWEIGGFDTFCFKTSWYRQHSWLFEDFIMGRPWYDHHYAGIMKIFGNNDVIGNKYPAFCLHEHHGFGACAPGNPEYDWNTNLFNKSEYVRKYRHIWDNFYKDVLNPGRTPYFYFLNEMQNEADIETLYFRDKIKKIQNLINEDRNKHNIV